MELDVSVAYVGYLLNRMSMDISSEHMMLYAFNQSRNFDSREFIDGLQFLKDKDIFDHVDRRPVVKANLKGSNDTNFFNSRNFYGDNDEGPKKPCLMVPKEEGSSERIQVRKAKSVHFADSCGLALASVSTLFDCEDDLLAFTNFSRSKDPVARNSFPSFKNKRNFESRKKSKFLNFVQPVTLPDFQQKILDNKVGLENVVFRDFSIYGTIVVQNLDFEKQVCVRYTSDAWKTNQDAKGVYLPCSSTGRNDTFSFEIHIPGGVEEECLIEFCIRYDTSGGAFWDNNNGQNYRILFHRSRSSSVGGNRGNDDPDGFVLGPAARQFAGYKM